MHRYLHRSRFYSYFSGYGFGHGSVPVLVTVANMPSSSLIAQTNGLIAFIHRGIGAVCHSCSLSVLEVLGESSDPGVGGSIPSGRTINKQPAIARNPPGVNVETE
jgi:hypothetical protein